MSLQARVDYLSRILPLQDMVHRGRNAPEVAHYYAVSHWVYRAFHSRQGAMHLALNPDGVFDAEGYAGQAALVCERLPAESADVLELAFGNGFNLERLLELHPDVRMTGIDLTETHVRAARNRLGPGVALHHGDFHHLPFGDASFDAVFAVESFCHAQDVSQALGEVSRVLRPNGVFIVIDAWRADGFSALPPSLRRSIELSEWAMALGQGVTEHSQWWRLAAAAGLTRQADVDLTPQVIPTLKRLERLSWSFLRRPRFIRMANAVLSVAARNLVAGFLLLDSLQQGGFTYRMLVAEKPSRHA